MKSVGVILLALVEIGAGTATGERTAPKRLVSTPKAFVGKKIVIEGISCVDRPKDRFLCLMIVNGETLRIEASALGAKTKIEIAEKLIGECKGVENLSRPSCRVDAEIEPTNAYKDPIDVDAAGKPIANIFSNQIDMYTPKRK